MFSRTVEQRALAETHRHRVEEALALVDGEALEMGPRQTVYSHDDPLNRRCGSPSVAR